MMDSKDEVEEKLRLFGERYGRPAMMVIKSLDPDVATIERASQLIEKVMAEWPALATYSVGYKLKNEADVGILFEEPVVERKG